MLTLYFKVLLHHRRISSCHSTAFPFTSQVDVYKRQIISSLTLIENNHFRTGNLFAKPGCRTF